MTRKQKADWSTSSPVTPGMLSVKLMFDSDSVQCVRSPYVGCQWVHDKKTHIWSRFNNNKKMCHKCHWFVVFLAHTSCWRNVVWMQINTTYKCANTFLRSLEHQVLKIHVHTHTHIHTSHNCVHTHDSVPHRDRWGWRACSLSVPPGSPHASSHKGSRYHVPVKHTITPSLLW